MCHILMILYVEFTYRMCCLYIYGCLGLHGSLYLSLCPFLDINSVCLEKGAKLYLPFPVAPHPPVRIKFLHHCVVPEV
jgi:hypothetical protein